MTRGMNEEMLGSALAKTKKYGVMLFLGLLALITLNASMFIIDAGQYAVERTPGGALVAHMESGYKFKWPFVSAVEMYDEVTTMTYDSNADGAGSSKSRPYPVTFSDTYGGSVKGSFRVVLPKDPTKMIALHRAFKRYDNFVENGALKFTNELLAYTANQFTGESFMQGGQNEYKGRLQDQAQNGLYVTKRTQVKVNTQAGIVDPNNPNASQTSDSQAVIYKNIVQRDDAGKPLRQENSMAQYGVTVTQVTIDGFDPEPDLKSFMTNKKKMVRKRASLVENQENERQQAITAKLQGDRQRVEAKQKMLMQKDQAEIALKQEVAVAKLQAEKETVEREKVAALAIIDKKKQLQEATANEGIQKAAERAAKYEAQAILHKGLAEAQVDAARLKAKQDSSSIVLAELHLQTVQALSSGLSNFQIEMPQYMMNGAGENGSSTNLDVLMSVMGINNLQQLKVPATAK